MSRPDLGATYGGWQALDATPQEISPHSRSHVVGPASLVAVKDGQDMKFDNEFVISEVNADLKYYYETEKDKFELAGANIYKVMLELVAVTFVVVCSFSQGEHACTCICISYVFASWVYNPNVVCESYSQPLI